MIELRPITQREAFAWIAQHHRHHKPPVGSIWQQAAYADGRLVGVAVAGRPVARALADGLTVEVTRVCTDGTRNACSALLGASRRVALALGYRRGITYTLASEPGTSLRAAGWRHLWDVRGRGWSCASRPRADDHPTEDKHAWGWGDWTAGSES